MSDPRIPLKNPWIAGILAYLIPGAGHLYQGRLFKAALYSICILGTFFYGMYLGDWRIVYHRWQPGKKHLGYLSQIMVGLPALPALVQSKRYVPPLPQDPWLSTIQEPISAPFEGMVNSGNQTSSISGTLTLEPVQREFGLGGIDGKLTGTLDGGMDVVLNLEQVRIQPRILADPRRSLKSFDVEDQQANQIEELRGTIPRPFWDWFEVPLDDETEEHLHGELGKRFELAAVLTWIAGLLNILAIWDALEGPAYGYGDEETSKGEEGKTKDNQIPSKANEASATASQPSERTAATT